MTQAVSKANLHRGDDLPQGMSSLDASVAAAQQAEDRLLITLVGISFLLHIAVLLFQGVVNKRPPIVLQDDAGIAADLVSEIEVGARESAMPDTIKGERRVPDKMLPQLPKTFTIDQPPVAAEPETPISEPAEPAKTAVTPTELPQPTAVQPEPQPEPVVQPEVVKSEPPKPEPQAPAESAKPAPQPEAVVPEPIIKTPHNEATNRLKKEDALKRLLNEQARQDKKFAKEKQAENQDALALAAAELAKKGVGLGQGAGGEVHSRYGQKLRKAVQPHYNIPEVYRMRASAYKVSITIQVAANGSLMGLEVEKSSGVMEFDESVLKAIRDAVPLPTPPPDLAGERITVNFSP